MWINIVLAIGLVWFAISMLLMMLGGFTRKDDLFWAGFGALLTLVTVGAIGVALGFAWMLVTGVPLGAAE